MMMDFEEQLSRALERRQPSVDFTGRVMERAAMRAKKPAAPVKWRSWAAVLLAASLFAGVVGVEVERERRVREQGRVARAQLLQAMQITSSKLQKIQKKVQGALR